MLKQISEIFYSLQGEGHNTGRAAVFVRFAFCNMSCPFCDTDYSLSRVMTDEEIVDEVVLYPARFVVLTGGEPALQTDDKLIRLLHECGFEIAIETNGSVVLPEGIDWVTCSPKGKSVISRCDELKCVFDGQKAPDTHGIEAKYYYLQPCDTGDKEKNKLITELCLEYIKSHPSWRLSLQTHKLAGFK